MHGDKNARGNYFPPCLTFCDHLTPGVSVPIFSISKTVSDVFRYRRTVGIDIAIEGLREAIRRRKTMPGEIARHATDGGVWKVIEPYLSALTSG
jgi:hypothetical protein